MVKSPTNLPSSLEFFKVFLSGVSSQQLSLPPAFVMQLNGFALKNATLKDHTGKMWNVQLEKTENDLIIKKGWQEFASHHSLVDADFLVFKYDGNSQFSVKLYGKNGLKKENTLPSKVSSTHMDESETEEEKNRSPSTGGCKLKYSEMTSKENGRQGRYGGSSKAAGSSGRRQYKFRQAAGSSRERRRELRQNTVAKNEKCKLGRAYVTPENPHFVTIMTRSTRYTLHIHKSVVKAHNIKLQEKVTLRDENGQLWPVKIIFRDDGRIGISEGWFNFRVKHKLAIKDMCVFEFKPREDNICNLIQVHTVQRNGEFDKKQAQPNTHVQSNE